MKKPVAYLVAILLHAAVIFGFAVSKPVPPMPLPEKKYIEVTLSAAPPPPAPRPAPLPPPQAPPPPPSPPPPEQPPPPTPEPPPPPKIEDSLPELKPEPRPQPSSPTQVVATSIPPAVKTPPQAESTANPTPIMPAPGQYLSISRPSFLSRVEPDYPLQARRQHQQGDVLLGLYINEVGSLDKVEVVKSSGYPLLDEAAMEAMKQSQFHPAYQDKTPVPAHAQVTISFQLN